jgi:hypothetical protein
MGERPQKTMVVAKTLQVWDKAVDKLCASGVLSCKNQIAEPNKKAAKHKAGRLFRKQQKSGCFAVHRYGHVDHHVGVQSH